MREFVIGALVGIPISVATSLTIVLNSDAYKAIEEKLTAQGTTNNPEAFTALVNSLGAGIVGGLFCGVIGGNLSNRKMKDYGFIGGIGGGIAAGFVSGFINIPKMP
jgi:hypothetical protein